MSFHPVSYSTADHPRWGKAHCSPGLLMGHLLGCAERQLQGWAWAGEVGSSWVAGEERPRLIRENFNLSSRLPHLKCRLEMALRLKRKYRVGSRLGIIQHRGLEPNPSSAPDTLRLWASHSTALCVCFPYIEMWLMFINHWVTRQLQ